MMASQALMTTKEVADYLRIKERTVYELVRERRIPCIRVTGKWLFPKALIELWVVQNSEGVEQVKSAVDRPPVVAGSHDPLLEWAVRESECDLAIMFNGSLDGLHRFAQGNARCCGLHVFDPDSGDYNRAVVARTLVGLEVVLIEWAWREQGLIVAAGNPHRIRDLSGLRQARLRLVERQEGAGSRLLFFHLLQAQGIDATDLRFTMPPARSETEVGLAIQDGKADAGFGIAAVARQCRLDFVPLQRERYDIAIGRRDYFEPAFQRLLSFARTARFVDKAAELEGYDISGLGRVTYNSP
ncbi:MAG TPA: helix-turn-helix transcriptional regulator [Candidatus Tectomicrobia bacterium]|nr:helix-turn-helix transcriptional regulator [Candidatus Tectomicrobia bacterium]